MTHDHQSHRYQRCLRRGKRGQGSPVGTVRGARDSGGDEEGIYGDRDWDAPALVDVPSAPIGRRPSSRISCLYPSEAEAERT